MVQNFTALKYNQSNILYEAGGITTVFSEMEKLGYILGGMWCQSQSKVLSIFTCESRYLRNVSLELN